jgi:hypothetical protein
MRGDATSFPCSLHGLDSMRPVRSDGESPWRYRDIVTRKSNGCLQRGKEPLVRPCHTLRAPMLMTRKQPLVKGR